MNHYKFFRILALGLASLALIWMAGQPNVEAQTYTTVNRGGTGTTSPFRILYGNGSTITSLRTGSGLNISGNTIVLDASGNWTGTLDGQEGTYYLDLSNHTGTLPASKGGTGSSSPLWFLFGNGSGIVSTSTIAERYIDPLIARVSALHSAVTLAGENYLSLSGQQITANAVNLGGSNVTGTLTVSKGGTGSTSPSGLLYGTGSSLMSLRLSSDFLFASSSPLVSLFKGSPHALFGSASSSALTATTTYLFEDFGAYTSRWRSTSGGSIAFANHALTVTTPASNDVIALRPLWSNILYGYDTIEFDVNFHGTSILTAGDTPTLTFDQSGDKGILLTNFATNGVNGWQHIRLPLSKFTANLDATPGAAGTGTALDTKTTVSNLKLRVYENTAGRTVSIKNVVLSDSTHTLMEDFTQPDLLSSDKPGNALFRIQGVDLMKTSKDNMAAQYSDKQMQRVIGALRPLNLTHMAISTPYDETGYAFTPQPRYAQRWADAIHNAGYNVFHRQHPNAWEGDYSFTKVVSNLGTATGTITGVETTTYLAQIYKYIITHPNQYAPGDIITPMAEPENGGINGITTCTNGCQFASANRFRTWLRDAITVTNAALDRIGLKGRVYVGFYGNSGFIVFGNGSHPNGYLDDRTVDAFKIVSMDHYPATITDYPADLATYEALYGQRPMVLTEWGTTNQSSTSTKQDAVDIVLNTLKSKPYMYGFNYWTANEGSNENLLDAGFHPTGGFATLQKHFTSGKPLSVASALAVSNGNFPIDISSNTPTAYGQLLTFQGNRTGSSSVALWQNATSTFATPLTVTSTGISSLAGPLSVSGSLNASSTLHVTGNGTIADLTAANLTANSSVTGNVVIAGLRFLGPDGSAGTPTYSFGTDTNTGMYGNGANQLRFTTDGTTRLTLDDTGMQLNVPFSLTNTLAVSGVSNFTNKIFASSTIYSSATGTSTFLGGLSVNALQTNLVSCDSLDTNSSGAIVCGTDATGAGGGAFPFSSETWGNATSTTLGFLNGFFSSGASSSISDTLNLYGALTSNYAGTSSFAGNLNVAGYANWGTTTIGTLNGVKYVDGVHYPKTSAGIQQALDDCKALANDGCGKVVVGAGRYNSVALTMPSNMILEGTGSSTLFVLGSSNGIFISGKSNVTVRNLNLFGDSIGAGNKCILVINSTDVVVDQNQVTCSRFAIFVDASGTSVTQRVWVTNNHILAKGAADAIGGGPQNSTGAEVKEVYVKNNFIRRSADGAAINFVKPYRIHFEENIAEGDILFGTEQWPASYSTIRNNTIKNASGSTCEAIGAIVDPSATSPYTMLDVSGNTIEHGFIDLFSNPSNYVKNTTVNGNRIDATGCTEGILLVNLNGGTVTGNVVSSSTSDGIKVNGSNHIVIANNSVAQSTSFGIRSINSSNFNTYSNNDVYSKTGVRYSLVETTTGSHAAGSFEVLNTSGISMLTVASSTYNLGLATTSPGSRLSVNGLVKVTGSGTSTYTGGLYANALQTNLLSCNQALETDASGAIICGNDATGAGGGAFPFTPNVWGNSTSTTLGFLNGFISSGASSTLTDALNLLGRVNASSTWYNSASGTSTFAGGLSVNGLNVANGMTIMDGLIRGDAVNPNLQLSNANGSILSYGNQSVNVGTRIVITVNSAEIARFAANTGNLGIGTTTPISAYQLSVKSPNILFSDTNTTLGANARHNFINWNGLTGSHSVGTTSDNNTSTSTYFTLRYNKMGLSSTTPAAALSVNGDGYITGGFGIGNATTTSGALETSGIAYFGGLVRAKAGLIVESFLRLVFGDNPTVDEGGEIAVDNTPPEHDQLVFFGDEVNAIVPPSFSFMIASSTSQGNFNNATTTFRFAGKPYGITLAELGCKVNGGTRVHIGIGDGSSTTTLQEATTTTSAFDISSNNTWTAYEDMLVSVGATAGTPASVACSILYKPTRQ